MAVVQHESEIQPPMQLTPVIGLASAIAMGVAIGYSISRPSGFTSSTTSQRQQPNSNRLNNTNLNNSRASPALAKPAQIRSRISKTYAYLAGSIGITGLSAYYCFNYTKYSRNAMMQIGRHPKWYLFTSLLSSIALLFATRATSYDRRPILKHLLWIAMNVHEGALLSILGFVGGPIIIKAAIYTAAILSGISLMSASASDEKVLKLGAYLGIGLGCLMGMSAIQFVYPSVGTSNAFQNVNIYGGILIFGLKMAFDTKKVLMKAKQFNVKFDPINEQIGLYLNSVNFFLDIIRLILKQQEEERRRKQQQQNDED